MPAAETYSEPLPLPARPTLPTLVRRNAREAPDEQVMVGDSGAISHAELDERSTDLACRMVAAGVGKGARVGVMMPNGLDWLCVAVATARTGAVLVPLSTLLRPPELEAQLRVGAVTHLVVVAEHRGRHYLDDLEAVAPGLLDGISVGRRHPKLPSLLSLWIAGEWPETRVPVSLVEALEARVEPADDLVVLFTSGSRGLPKGTIHTHGNALRATSASLPARRVGRGERLYIPMPFFWTGGFTQGLLAVLVACATLITEETPNPERTLALLEREMVTLFRGWPDQASRLAAHPSFVRADLSRLGPASLPAVLPTDSRPRPGSRPVLFGMTETGGPWCGGRLDEDLPESAWGSCGRPFAGVELRVVDVDTKEPCGPGEIGEMWLRGPNLMRGICGRTRDDVFGVDGFYATGDLGSVDEAGFVRFHGRRDDMFKVSGATVYPSEVEAALRSIDGVTRAYVTDVNDAAGVARVGALVVTEMPVDELVDQTQSRLSAFKVPSVWIATADDEVPLLGSGKVDKAGLQELLVEAGVDTLRDRPRPTS